jgi:uncharacterized membrane protein YfcA
VDPLGLPDAPTVVLLIAVAVAAGWVDAVSGGGGMLQLPVLFLALPDAEPVQALATNKASSIAGTAAATSTYSRRVRPDVRTALPMVVAAVVGSAIGAVVASHMPADVFRPVIVVLLAIVWVWTLVRPTMGMESALRWHGRKRHYVVATTAGLVIGMYDGLLGPGTGSFLLIVLVGVLGYSFLQASSTAKVVNLGTNAAAMVVFAATGSVLWVLGGLMAIGNVAGGIVGARMAIRRGSGFVRLVFLAVVGVLILRLAWDLLP